MEYVILDNKNGTEKPFLFDHALRILRMANQGGWIVSKNSKYEYVNGELIRRRDKKEDRKRPESARDSKVEAKEVSSERSFGNDNPKKRVQSRTPSDSKMD